MGRDEMIESAADALRARLETDGWRVKAEVDGVSVEHDLSCSRGLHMREDDDASQIAVRVTRLLDEREFEVIRCRPHETPHAELIKALRMASMGLQWPGTVVPMVAHILAACDVLDQAEADWLYEAGATWSDEAGERLHDHDGVSLLGVAQRLFRIDGIEVFFMGLSLRGESVAVALGGRMAANATPGERARHERAEAAFQAELKRPYRARRPGAGPSPPLLDLLQRVEIAVDDDAATVYAPSGGHGASGDRDEATREARFRPGVPANATAVVLRFTHHGEQTPDGPPPPAAIGKPERPAQR
jgi:hypothetical protein